MKVLKRWLLFVTALLLTAAGAAMPRIVSTIQDANVENDKETRTFDPVNLKLMKGEGVQEVLRLLAESIDEMEWPGTTKLTVEDAGEAVRNVVILMYKSGLIRSLPENFADIDISAQPHFVMSTDDSNLSAVLWMCRLEGSAENWFYIDDETGKMVRAIIFDGPHLEMNSMASTVGFEGTTQRLDEWRVFLSEYYEMELEFSDMNQYDDGYNMSCTMSFDAGGQTGTLFVNLVGEDVYINS